MKPYKIHRYQLFAVITNGLILHLLNCYILLVKMHTSEIFTDHLFPDYLSESWSQIQYLGIQKTHTAKVNASSNTKQFLNIVHE